MSKRRKKRTSRRSAIGVLLLIIAAAALILTLLAKAGVISPQGWFSFLRKKPAAPDAGTSVRFIDVGQGDCTLVISEGKAMLIDSGETDGRDKVIAYIRSLGIKRLERIIVTHPHSDHMGEMADIIDSFQVGSVSMPLLPDALIPKTYSYEKMMKSIRKRGAELLNASDESFDLGEIKVTTYAPKEYAEDLNNCSTVVLIRHGDNSFLVTGDCEKEEEAWLLERGAELKADVLRVGHHGSSSATTEPFLAAVRPMYAVISCAAANDYGHPSEKTLKRLRAFAQEIFITRDNGTVTFVSDGSGLSIYTEK